MAVDYCEARAFREGILEEGEMKYRIRDRKDYPRWIVDGAEWKPIVAFDTRDEARLFIEGTKVEEFPKRKCKPRRAK